MTTKFKIDQFIWYVCEPANGILYQKTRIKTIDFVNGKNFYKPNGYNFFEDDESVFGSEYDVIFRCAYVMLEKARLLKQK